MKNRKLEDAVEARKKELKKIVKFVESITEKIGVVTKREQGSSNTRVVRRLENFAGFTFVSDEGQTMFGGNDYKVYFGRALVLLVYCQDRSFDASKYRVDVFEKEGGWQKALTNVMKNKNKIVARRAKEACEQAQKAKNDWVSKEKKAETEKTAKRLGL